MAEIVRAEGVNGYRTVTLELTAASQSGDYEDRLALQAREGDRSAFDELVRRYSPRLFRFACRMLQNPADAEDVVQSSLLRAYRGLEAYRPGGHFGSWIYRIALNECRRRLRSRRGDAVCAEETALATAAGPSTDPENVAIKHDRNRIVQNAVMSLPQHYREAVLLFYFDGLSVEEAAQAMGTSVTAAKVRLHRARAKLGAALEGRL